MNLQFCRHVSLAVPYLHAKFQQNRLDSFWDIWSFSYLTLHAGRVQLRTYACKIPAWSYKGHPRYGWGIWWIKLTLDEWFTVYGGGGRHFAAILSLQAFIVHKTLVVYPLLEKADEDREKRIKLYPMCLFKTEKNKHTLMHRVDAVIRATNMGKPNMDLVWIEIAVFIAWSILKRRRQRGAENLQRKREKVEKDEIPMLQKLFAFYSAFSGFVCKNTRSITSKRH